MGKNSPSQQRLLEIGGLLDMDDCVEALEIMLKRGFKKELALLKDEELDTTQYENVTPLFKKVK